MRSLHSSHRPFLTANAKRKHRRNRGERNKDSLGNIKKIGCRDQLISATANHQPACNTKIKAGMAHHLPPKIPTTNSPSTNFHTSPWIHEFLGFSDAKRVAHRRAVSDSSTAQPSSSPDLDDEQLLSILSDDVPPPSPSDHNSINDDGPNSSPPSSSYPPFRLAHDHWEAQSSCNAHPPPPASGKDSAPQPILHDHKRVKRILANRYSAQRSRVRKLHYISELERSVASLQTEVSVLSPRVAFYDHQRSVLSVGNSHLKQRIAAITQDNIFKDAHHEALKKEIERLRQVYHQQSLKRMAVDQEQSIKEECSYTVKYND